MLYYEVVFAAQLFLYAGLLLCLRPIINRYIRPANRIALYAGVWFCALPFLQFYDLGASLLRIPWPMPYIASPIAALDYQAAESWEQTLTTLWILGICVCAAIRATSYIVFRLKVRWAARPCPERIARLAETVARDLYTRQIQAVCEDEAREMTPKERARIERAKVPKICLTDAAVKPMLLAGFPGQILLDRADYTDAELSAIVRFASAQKSIDIVLGTLLSEVFVAICWFNPASWLLLWDARQMLIMFSDEAALIDASSEEKRAYAETLAYIGYDRITPPGALCVGGSPRCIRARLRNMLSTDPYPLLGRCVSCLIVALFVSFRGIFAVPALNQTSKYPISEPALVCLLGNDSKVLGFQYDRNTIGFLVPTDAEDSLFGAASTVYYAGVTAPVQMMVLNFEDTTVAADGAERLYSYLKARLGEPMAYYKESLMSEGYRGVQDDWRYVWTARTKDDRSAQITMGREKDIFNLTGNVFLTYHEEGEQGQEYI